MKCLSFISFLASVLCSVGVARAGDPPSPSFEKPVDYVAWIHKEFGGRIKENAADRYAKAIEAFVTDVRAYDIAKKPARSWTAEEKRAVAKWVERNEAALAEVRAASKVRRCYFEGTSETGIVYDIVLSHLPSMRNLAYAGTARARLRLMEGDMAGALDDVGAVLRASRHQRQQPHVISYLVGLATASLAYQALAELPVIAKGEVDYAGLFEDLAKMDQRPVSMRSALRGELAGQYDLLQRCARDAGGDGRIEKIVFPEGIGVGEDITVDPPIELDVIAAVVRDYLKAIYSAEKYRYPEVLESEKKSEEDRKSLGTAAGILDSLWVIEKIRRRCEMDRHGTWVILKMHAYRAANGAWPGTLEEAMKGASPTLRWDPFSNGELKYILISGEPVVYSVGADGEDNQGRDMPDDGMGEKGDILLWPLSEE